MTSLAARRENLRQFYDARYATGYMDKHEGLAVKRVKDVLGAVPIRVHTLLDYGCGQGGWLPVLCRAFPSARITGVDISRVAIRQAQERYPEYQFHLMEGEMAPLEAESFDLVFSYHVLEHVYDIEKTAADMARLLKKGGYLCLICPCGNDGSWEERVTRLIKHGKEKSITGERRFFYEDAGHLRRMTSKELINLFKDHGLTVCREFYAQQFWGAINWLSKADGRVVRRLFAVTQAVDRRAKWKLRGGRIFFLYFLTPLVQLSSLDLHAQIKQSDNNFKKFLLACLMPFKAVSLPLGIILDKLAAFEWHRHKYKRNGSEQYLLFQKV